MPTAAGHEHRRIDELIARIRERAADPERRVDARRSPFLKEAQAMDLGELMGQVRGLAADLGRLVDATRSGRAEPELQDKAERIGASMSRRTFTDLPARADEADVQRVEKALGLALPTLLRRLYVEVADGGFGPHYGLLPIAKVESTYRALRNDPPGPPELEWPRQLAPILEVDGDFVSVDLGRGSVIAFDAEALLEQWDPESDDVAAARRGWEGCFREEAPNLGVWFERWLAAPSDAERASRQVAESRSRSVQEARERMKAMSPERLKELGFPDIDWDKAFE